jgi:biopolymer transport protein ExbD
MAGGGFSSSDEELFSGINITPLVDVVLVLLIIFMITAPVIYQSAIKVSLPKAATGEEASRSPLTFTITKEGALNWDKELVAWDQLGPRLAAAVAKSPDQPAVISADEATPHGTVIRLMDALRQAGISRFALNVESSARH